MSKNPSTYIPASRQDLEPKIAFGVTNPTFLRRAAKPELRPMIWGMFDLLYGTPERAYIAHHDTAGNVDGWVPLRAPLHGKQFVHLDVDVPAPKIGEPHHRAMVADPKVPFIVTGSWSAIARIAVLQRYDILRNTALEHPQEGHGVATFLGEDVPCYAAHGATDFDVRAAWGKVQQMYLVRDALEACHPELGGVRRPTVQQPGPGLN